MIITSMGAKALVRRRNQNPSVQVVALSSKDGRVQWHIGDSSQDPCSSLLNKQIAAELGISEITIRASAGRITRQIQVEYLADLVRVAAVLQAPLVPHI
jgi:DNA-binding CsgD family transcriptional regulator